MLQICSYSLCTQHMFPEEEECQAKRPPQINPTQINLKILQGQNSLEATDPRNLISRMYDRRRPSLRPRQYDIDEFGSARHGRHLFEVVHWHYYFRWLFWIWARAKQIGWWRLN